MKKKILLGLGAATSIIAPIATVVACDAKISIKNHKGNTSSGNGNTSIKNHKGNTSSGNGNTSIKITRPTSPAKNLFSAKDHIQYRTLASIGRDKNAPWGKVTITKDAVEKLKAFRKIRNADTNINWHTIGDNVIDAVNDIRYAVMRSAKKRHKYSSNI